MIVAIPQLSVTVGEANTTPEAEHKPASANTVSFTAQIIHIV